MHYTNDTLCGLFHNQAQRFGDAEMLRGKFDKNGNPQDTWGSMTWKETQEESLSLGRGLMALGLKPKERVALFSENRPRWVVADQAIQALGAILVPLYPTLTLKELTHMLKDSGANTIIVSNPQKAEMALQAKAQGIPLKTIITITPFKEPQRPNGVKSLLEVVDTGRAQGLSQAIEERIKRVSPEDIASIIYTSGTTGLQKGAILTHKNFIANIAQHSNSTIFKRLKSLELRLTHLCCLPLCHVYGRTCDYHVGSLHLGNVLIFAESFEKIPQTLLEVRPNVINSIPRFYEKFHQTVLSIISRQNQKTQKAFYWAMRAGQKFTESMAHARKAPWFDTLHFTLANAFVFNKIRRLSGMDRLVFASSGGGKLSKEVCTFIRSLGIQLSEGYGLTETSPTINLNEPEFEGIEPESAGWWTNLNIDWTIDTMVTKLAKGKSPHSNPFRALKLGLAYRSVAYRLKIKPGTVGKPVIWTEERLDEDGEILVKGPQVFQGYWNMLTETKECFTEDGFFKTGDIGAFDEDGYLSITDRKKEIFVTSGGKNIPPTPIELALMAKPFVDQACLIGDSRNYLTALICPDLEPTHRYAKEKGISWDSDKELLKSPEVQALFQGLVDEINETLPRYAQIKYFTLLDEPFSIESQELTPTLKLKRKVIEQRRKELIEAMYSEKRTLRKPVDV